jgi:hypothetical protein
MLRQFFVPCDVITNAPYYNAFKVRSLAEQPLSVDEKYRFLEALYEEARRLGRFGPHDLLLGLEDSIRLAAALNANVSNPPR